MYDIDGFVKSHAKKEQMFLLNFVSQVLLKILFKTNTTIQMMNQ